MTANEEEVHLVFPPGIGKGGPGGVERTKDG